MLTNAKHTLAHVTYTPLVLTYADRTCALANLDILEMDAIVQRQVLLIVSKTYKRVFCLIQTCMALGWKSESLFQTCDANVSADASLAVQIQGFTRFNHPDANADASVNARNEKFFIFLSLYLHLHTLLALVSPGNANANARRKNTGSIDSMPPRHSSNQEDVEVFRHFGNFLYFPTEVFFSCTSKHIETTNILVLYRGILREKISCASSKIQTFDLSAGSASDTILCSRWFMMAKSSNKIYVKKPRQHNRIIPRVIHTLCWD